ncbi:class I SAM-dependent methyltransferase [Candidatus Nanosalina sp. VS9-1]|uniref:class I SAM-dependent methyltransferase n=1 Tax=Candidatus Nanosalina sp. VS9-1 TaxID=3388566 RepID=UPI0039E0CCDC
MTYSDFEDYAALYDIVSESKSDGRDVEFYVEEASKVDGKVLEVACGTGRIYLEMLEAGVDAYGIDISEAMLEILREKAESRGLEPEVEKANMQDFDLDEKFSLIMIPYRSFHHNLTVDDQLATLETIYEHLEDGGKFILNFYCPDFEFISENYGEELRSDIEGHPELELVEFNEFVDPVDMIIEFEKKVLEDGEVKWSSTGKSKMTTKTEFELLLRNSSFSEWNVYGGFDLEELENSEQEMVWIIEK